MDEWRFQIEAYQSSGIVAVGSKQLSVAASAVPRGGIVLRNVYHADYRLAYDLATVGIWIFPGKRSIENGYRAKYLVLGPPDFIQLKEDWSILRDGDMIEILKTNNESVGFSNNMKVFNSSLKGELMARFRSTEEVFGPGSGYLFITQRLLFTDYDSEPAHEATASLLASRLHPMVHVHYEHALEGWVKSIRVDYRMHFNLDSWWYYRLKRKPTQWMDDGGGIEQGRETADGKIHNAAGVFRDDDQARPLLDGVLVEDVVFEAAEKPLKYEILSEGINDSRGRAVWDNIHWWGVNRDRGSISPSTPGAFHAMHMHWRWGLALQEERIYTPKYGGDPQFKGHGVGGLMVDPRIDRQILRFAVVKNQGLSPDIHAHSTEDPTRFFKRQGEKPDEILSGEDICFYYSVEINLNHRSSVKMHQKSKTLSGYIFVHGLYFAHEDEKWSFTTGGIGYTRAVLNIRPQRVPHKWIRFPDL